MNQYNITEADKQILREVAKQQLEYANQDSNKDKIALWYKHNALQGERPMIHLEMGTFKDEIIPQRLKCEGDFARSVEENLYCNFLNQALFEDDRVTPDYYPETYDTHFTLFGINIHKHNAAGSVGHEFQSYIEDLEDDYEKLKETDFGLDKESTRQRMEILGNTFGDILPIRLQMDGLYSVPTQMLVHFMKMENMMFNMYDYPELFKTMMGRIADDTLAYFRMLEKEGAILPTTGGEGLGQGTWCYNHELATKEDRKLRPLTTHDVWGFMDSQETVGISPEMYKEFIFPCYQKIAGQFGLLSYGCCEPVDPIWDSCISKLENLRKVSISPWCNEAFMGERLQGSHTIYHRKPSPNYLGVGTTLDEEAVRKSIRTTMDAAKGCKIEFTQRDVYTINHDIAKAKRYVDIIREESVQLMGLSSKLCKFF